MPAPPRVGRSKYGNRSIPVSAIPAISLHSDDLDQLSHSISALFQRGLFFSGEFDFDNLLQAVGAQLTWHPYEQVFDPILALEINGTGQDFLLVLEDGLDHLGCRRGGGVI